jgi:hypothetical protein
MPPYKETEDWGAIYTQSLKDYERQCKKAQKQEEKNWLLKWKIKNKIRHYERKIKILSERIK